jgi:histidine triad (HIT) family protein
MTTDDCLFCRMAAGTLPVDKLHEDDLVFAIRDINPRAPTHLLVIPREHIPTAHDVTAAHGDLMARMLGVAGRLMDQLGLADRGYRLAINVGAEGGQTVYHLHMHVLAGRRLGAEG